MNEELYDRDGICVRCKGTSICISCGGSGEIKKGVVCPTCFGNGDCSFCHTKKKRGG